MNQSMTKQEHIEKTAQVCAAFEKCTLWDYILISGLVFLNMLRAANPPINEAQTNELIDGLTTNFRQAKLIFFPNEAEKNKKTPKTQKPCSKK